MELARFQFPEVVAEGKWTLANSHFADFRISGPDRKIGDCHKWHSAVTIDLYR